MTLATVAQNDLVTVGPRIDPTGSRGLVVRISSIQVSGSVQRVFIAGPVGPLLNPFSRWPQWPS